MSIGEYSQTEMRQQRMRIVSRTDTGNRSEQTFDQLISPFYADLFRYCQQVTGSKWDAEDLLQETLLKTYGAIHQGETTSRLQRQLSKAYLRRIALNTWIDQCRKKQREPEHLTHLLDLTVPAEEQHEQQSDQFHTALQQVFSQLTRKQSVAFVLSEAFQYTAAEIGQLIGSSEGAVKALLFRAKEKLRASKQEQDGQEPATDAPGRKRDQSERTEADGSWSADVWVNVVADAVSQQYPHRIIRLLASHGRQPEMQLSRVRSKRTVPAHLLRRAVQRSSGPLLIAA